MLCIADEKRMTFEVSVPNKATRDAMREGKGRVNNSLNKKRVYCEFIY
nr:hypothetical protein [Legionella israelensis]